jgi:hypothetical protein
MMLMTPISPHCCLALSVQPIPSYNPLEAFSPSKGTSQLVGCDGEVYACACCGRDSMQGQEWETKIEEREEQVWERDKAAVTIPLLGSDKVLEGPHRNSSQTEAMVCKTCMLHDTFFSPFAMDKPPQKAHASSNLVQF